MKERPILFSGPMVRAILEGHKTQTRRVVNLQPECVNGRGRWRVRGGGSWPILSTIELREYLVTLSPYGKPGERLWVRETFALYGMEAERPQDRPIFYRADDDSKPGWATPPDLKWQPSIFMPRWASRITLEILSVKVERVQDISEADARAEGIQVLPLQSESDPSAWYQSAPGVHQERTARASFRGLWDSINAKRNGGKFSWSANPWVWVVEFKKVAASSPEQTSIPLEVEG